MRTIGNSKFTIRRVDEPIKATHSLWQNGVILLTVNKQGRHSHAAIAFFGCLNSATEQRLKDVRPIVVDPGRQSARLAQCFLIDLDILVRESIAPKTSLPIHLRYPGEIIRARPRFRQARQLEEEHVPTMTKLPQSEVSPPGGRRRNLHCHQLRNKFRMSLSEGPSHAGSPIMSYNRGLLLTEMADQANNILHQEFDAIV